VPTTGLPPNILSIRVPDEAAGDRLDRFLAELPEIGSRSAAERLLAAGSVLVDGSARPKSHRLEGGEELEVELPAEAPKTLEREEVEFRVPYEDEHLLVVDKPAGVVVHPGAGHGSGTLVQGLVGRAEGGEEDRPGIVHRLDRDTSGLLVVARSEEAHKLLQDMVRRRAVERHYVALVRGRPRSWRGRIEAPIGRDREEPTRRSLDTDTPREAVTHFEVVELLGGNALLDVRLETGRTHQIRVHLAAVDLPVVGDPVYGVPDEALGRQFLHAGRLSFDHPFTNERIDVESPLPPELDAYLSRLRGSG
jgi:23S rRNA pseudouridine1911/1915/1917 synthase